MNTVEAAIAEHYRAIISEKTTHALAHLKAQGRRYSGLAPYGYAYLTDGLGTQVVPDAGEQRILSEARRHANAGASLRHIANLLNEAGYTARSGRPFAPSTLAGILKREEVTV
jgi:DNA invertase Pin-like site-specific DNA recombinase